MADNPQTLALVTLAQNFRGNTVRQVNRRAAALRLFPIVRGEGKNCAFVPESTGQLAENYTEGADAANFGSDAQASATLSWGLYRSNFRVTELAMDASSTSRTPEGNLRLWARNLVNSSAALASHLNGEIFAGPGTGTRMAGLGVAIGDDTNTYATIDRAAQSFWRPTVVDPGALTAPTFALIRDDLRKIFEASGMMPDIALCSPAVFNKVAGLFDSNRRWIQEVTTARGLVRLDFGYQGLEVDGCVFVKDKDATANQIFYVNTNHVRLEVLPSAAQEAMLALIGESVVPADDGFGAIPLGFKYEKLAKTGPFDKAQILSTLQLVCDRPNACGVRKNVAV